MTHCATFYKLNKPEGAWNVRMQWYEGDPRGHRLDGLPHHDRDGQYSRLAATRPSQDAVQPTSEAPHKGAFSFWPICLRVCYYATNWVVSIRNWEPKGE